MQEGYRNVILLKALVSVLLLHFQAVDPLGLTYLRARTGDIKSYFYPRCYPKHYAQDWKIVAPIGYRISLQFIDFNLGPCNNGNTFTVMNSKFGRESESDSFTGVSREKGNLYLCGEQLPPTIESLRNEMLFYFPYQPWRTKGCKFWAHYEMFKENEVTPTQQYKINTTLQPLNESRGSVTYLKSRSGDIKSRFYPHNYPKDYTQQWLIQVPRDYCVSLTFKDFNVANCMPNGDHLDVWYGRRMPLQLCGQQLPSKVESLDEMELYFYSDPESRGGRFLAHYEMFKENKTKTIYPTLQTTRYWVDLDTGNPESNGSAAQRQYLMLSLTACVIVIIIVTLYHRCCRRQLPQSPTPANVPNNADLEIEDGISELNFGDAPPSYEEVTRQSDPDISSITQQPSGESYSIQIQDIDSIGLPSYREALRLPQRSLDTNV